MVCRPIPQLISAEPHSLSGLKHLTAHEVTQTCLCLVRPNSFRCFAQRFLAVKCSFVLALPPADKVSQPRCTPASSAGSTPSGEKGSGAFIITLILMIIATFIFCFKIVSVAN